MAEHRREGIQEWNLVLTPAKPTQRDGAFSQNEDFKGSYLLSGSTRYEFKWP